MRISDWSSDVCSSDLTASPPARAVEPTISPIEIRVIGSAHHYLGLLGSILERHGEPRRLAGLRLDQPGRADSGTHAVLVRLIFQIAGPARPGIRETIGLPCHIGRPLLDRKRVV